MKHISMFARRAAALLLAAALLGGVGHEILRGAGGAGAGGAGGGGGAGGVRRFMDNFGVCTSLCGTLTYDSM